MEMLSHFEWWRDSKGYVSGKFDEIGVTEYVSVQGMRLPKIGSSKRIRIVGCGGKKLTYRPFASFTSLCLQFAKVRTPSDLLGFIEKFGLLSDDRPVFTGKITGLGEDVARALGEAKKFRLLLTAKSEGPAALGQAIRKNPGPIMGAARLVLRPDHAKGARIAIELSSLLDGLWLQLGHKLAGNANFRSCLHCHEWFETGPGTGRRLDARYCSDEHRVEYHSRHRSKGP